ncbi:MAG: carboxymuconolactone decarboxylase family protein [Hyphomicrobiaceae bacterium]
MTSATCQSLSPLPPDQWNSSLSNVLSDMNDAPLNVHKLMAHNPQLLQAWWNFRNYSVSGGTLGPRLGELVILRVSVHISAWYEWASHVDRSLRCGLNLDEINAVLDRDVSDKWSPKEAALLSAIDELMEDRSLSAKLRARLTSHFTPAEVLDIIAIHGMYVTLGCMICSWGLELDPAVSARIEKHTTPESFAKAAIQFQDATGSGKV